jgi:hypothetical protein
MGEQFLFDKPGNPVKYNYDAKEAERKQKDDRDLIVEDNTIYEIDRECYERLKRQRKRKLQEKRTV